MPDTPDKVAAASASAASFRNPFSRTSSVPSFAALGAAFRAGANNTSAVPFTLPPPPRVPSDRMDWTGEGEGDEDEDEEESEEESERGRASPPGSSTSREVATPKKQTARQVLVPDT